MRRVFLLAPVLLAPVLLAACGHGKPDPRGLDRDETLLSLSAMGEAETVPDEAGIEVGVESYAVTAQAASAAVAKKGEAIAAALASYGVEAKDLQTRNLSVNRVDYGKFKGQFQGGGMPMPMAYAEQASGASAPARVSAPPPTIRPGTSLMQVTVSVDFALEPK